MVQPCCSFYYQNQMQNLLIECGVEKYKYYFKGVLFMMQYDVNTNSCGRLKYSQTIPAPRGLIPKEDQEKIDNFLERMSSVMSQCCLNAHQDQSFMVD